ncbi:MAG: helix-turn-helix transcriptional regulator [Candidatus Aminicenantales bacterium]
MRNEKLRTVRVLKRLPQDALAALTGLDRSVISRIENGWLEPSAQQRKTLAAALGVLEGSIFSEPKKR